MWTERQRERWAPWLFAGLVALVVSSLWSNGALHLKTTLIERVVPSTIGVAAAMAGFVLTSNALVLGMAGQHYLKMLNEAGGIERLLKFMFSALVSSLVLLAFSLGLLLWHDRILDVVYPYVFLLWIALVAFVMAQVFRVGTGIKAVVATRFLHEARLAREEQAKAAAAASVPVDVDHDAQDE